MSYMSATRVRGVTGRLAAAVAIAAAVAACSSDEPSTDRAATSTTASSLRSSTVAVGPAAWGVAIDVARGRAWVSDPARGVVVTVDADGNVLDEYGTGDADPRATGMQVAGDRVWIANLGGTVTALDAVTGARVAGTAVGPGEPAALLVRDGIVWVPLHGPAGGLARLDAATLAPLDRTDLPESAFAITDPGEDRIWVAGLDRRAFAIDGATGEVVETVDVGAAPRGITSGAGSVWVTTRDDGALVRLDPDSGDVAARIDLGGQPWPVAYGGGFVWVATVDGRVLQVDPATNEVVASVRGPQQPRSIGVGLGSVWVAGQDGNVARIAVED